MIMAIILGAVLYHFFGMAALVIVGLLIVAAIPSR